MLKKEYEDGEYEQNEYRNKLLADEFSDTTIEEMEEECEYWERVREQRRVRNCNRI